MDTKYLFLASIGPVQSFIASARRSRDLYFGSWLLSELAKAAAKEIADSCGLNNLIFPAPARKEALFPDSPLNVANKIVALIDQQPNEIGEKVRYAIFGRLRGIRDNAYKGIDDFDKDTAIKQVDDLVEYFWVAVKYDGNYATARSKAEALMAARKNTRNFEQVKWGSHRPKSSIDGQLESVIPEDKYPDRKDKDIDRKRKVQILYRIYGASGAEFLSGIDLLKRNGKTYPETFFPSTSHMATVPFLDRLTLLSGWEEEKAQTQWNKYIYQAKKLSEGKMDRVSGIQIKHPILGDVEGSLLFEERLVDLLDFVDEVNTSQFRVTRDALRLFYRDVDNYFHSHARPDPYYAILQADGDGMGKIIDTLAQVGPDQHRHLSKALDSFTKQVRNIIKSHKGATIYSGGDEVLAFLPLHTAFECASELAENFANQLKSFINYDGHSPTLSVGLAIVHHLHPLWDALNIARAAEKKAKDVPGKDALAITVRKRSGGEYTLADKWEILKEHMEQLINYCRNDMIPDGTAYELRDMLLRLSIPQNDPEYWTLQNAIQADTVRILQRKLSASMHKSTQREEGKGKEVLQELLKLLNIDVPSKPVSQFSGLPSPSESVEKLINMLLVAQTFADARKLALLQ
jgi:CRISPR-associated protein Cmr2